MHRLVTGFAASAALALLASASTACEFHDVTASVPKEEVVAMSTADDATPPVVITTTSTTCAAGQANCAPSNK